MRDRRTPARAEVASGGLRGGRCGSGRGLAGPPGGSSSTVAAAALTSSREATDSTARHSAATWPKASSIAATSGDRTTAVTIAVRFGSGVRARRLPRGLQYARHRPRPRRPGLAWRQTGMGRAALAPCRASLFAATPGLPPALAVECHRSGGPAPRGEAKAGRLPGRAAPGGVQGTGRAGHWAVRSEHLVGRTGRLPRFAQTQLLSATAPRGAQDGRGRGCDAGVRGPRVEVRVRLIRSGAISFGLVTMSRCGSMAATQNRAVSV